MYTIRLLLLILSLALAAVAQIDRLYDNPNCTLPCLLEGLSNSDCSTTDQACLCQDTDFLHYVESCAAASCSVKEALVTQKITQDACDFSLHDEFGAMVVPRIILFALLPTLAVVLRVSVKVARLATWGADDTTIVLAYCVLIGLFSADMLWGKFGAGRDLWSLTPYEITHFFLTFYVLQVLYHCTITLAKASILFMYLRIFPDERFRRVVWGTHAFNFSVGLVYLLITLFQCQPINLAWTFWTGETNGHCVSIERTGMGQGTINVALDLWMLALPATQIWGLNMKRRKKIAVMSMFSLGLFLTVVSIIRILTIKELAKYPLNPTAFIMPAAMWTDIEVYVAIFVACIPNTRQFIWGVILRRHKRGHKLDSDQIRERSPVMIFRPKTPVREICDTVDISPRATNVA